MRLIIIFLFIFSQVNAQQIRGIGSAKIGNTYSMVIGNAKVYEIVKYGTKVKNGEKKVVSYITIKDSFFAVRVDTSKRFGDWPERMRELKPFLISKLPGVKTYFIPFLSVGDIKVSRVFVFFRNDTLCYLHVDAPVKELIDALANKYEPIIIHNKIDTIHCKYALTGASVDEYGFNYSYRWKSNECIAEFRHIDEFDKNCKIIDTSWFIDFTNPEIDLEFESLLRKMKNEFDNNEKDNNKKISDDL